MVEVKPRTIPKARCEENSVILKLKFRWGKDLTVLLACPACLTECVSRFNTIQVHKRSRVTASDNQGRWFHAGKIHKIVAFIAPERTTLTMLTKVLIKEHIKHWSQQRGSVWAAVIVMYGVFKVSVEAQQDLWLEPEYGGRAGQASHEKVIIQISKVFLSHF